MGEEGKGLDVSMGHFRQKTRKYENQHRENRGKNKYEDGIAEQVRSYKAKLQLNLVVF